ncbi:hypothetical protein HLRTI_000938 [Halorhabdus tiamatea SARL4B]|uniref:Uncharacterized protein n=1 Tax=Halorhabdus tiamatea SARL4B TaxID=1033806 RepID=U2FAL7_9EURY|nr:hypothetical protein HLRTI_000938 [Halorhabdus tiamatea SARL4B]
MNLSSKMIQECDGQVRDDRPDYVEELTLQRKVGWQEGSPIVGDPVGLGDDLSQGYEHYRRRDELFQPDAGKFLSELFESDYITSLEDASEELNTEKSTLEKACDLHGIDLPESQSSDPQEPESDTFVFPNGESWPLELLQEPVYADVRVLSQLLATNGMSVEESARYISDRFESNVTASDVRQEAQRVNIL